MRHKRNDLLFVTNGIGMFFTVRIDSISKKEVICVIDSIEKEENKLSNIAIAFPPLKSQDRFEFAIEKSIELGITNFNFFYSTKSVVKKINETRIKKIFISAMKQSLRTWLPTYRIFDSLKNLISSEGNKIYFNQKSEDEWNGKIIDNERTTLIIGPEGGFSEREMDLLRTFNSFKLSDKRLRTETAVIKSVSLLND